MGSISVNFDQVGISGTSTKSNNETTPTQQWNGTEIKIINPNATLIISELSKKHVSSRSGARVVYLVTELGKGVSMDTGVAYPRSEGSSASYP